MSWIKQLWKRLIKWYGVRVIIFDMNGKMSKEEDCKVHIDGLRVKVLERKVITIGDSVGVSLRDDWITPIAREGLVDTQLVNLSDSNETVILISKPEKK